jgi:CRISPR-associated endonuclease Cas1
LNREGVALFLMEHSGECVTLLADAPQIDARRKALQARQKQFRALLDPRKRLEIARKIVAAKLRTLGLHPVDARDFRQELARIRHLEDILSAEARAGAAFFLGFRDVGMRFNDVAIPSHWPVFVARAATFLNGRRGVSKARHAATPWGAMLNYGYTVALGQCTRAIVSAGLDPCFGFLHSPKPGRLSLSYDVLELHRADLTRQIFAYGARRPFLAADFEASYDGIVRLAPQTAREVATLALKTVTLTAATQTIRCIINSL